MNPRVAMLTFAEPRPDFYHQRLNEVVFEREKAITSFGEYLELVSPEPIRSVTSVREAAAEARRQNVHALILQIPIWTEPALVAQAAILVDKPLLLLGNERSYRTSSLVGLLASGGGLDQAGIRHKRVLGDIGDALVRDAVLAFCRAARAKEELRGQVFGCFGGRPLGMITATADPAQWLKIWGVDIAHVDQSLIMVKGDQVPQDEVDAQVEWLTRSAGAVVKGERFTDPALERQIRSYIAVRNISAERSFDFIGVKCQEEIANNYCVQCVSQSLLGDPYDAEGEKEPMVSACEADMDGALSMQILKLVSGGMPTNLMDVRHYDEEQRLFTFANCGSMPTFFSAYSRRPAENLAGLHLRPHVFGEAGGATTQIVAGAAPVTMARLMRRDGRYWMAIIQGEFVPRDREELRKSTYAWPHGFFRVSSGFRFEEFLEHYGSNHVHAVPAIVANELKEFCRLSEIEYREF